MLTSCTYQIDNPVPANPESEKSEATDYSIKANWLSLPTLYYNNIVANVAERCATYQGSVK